VTKTEGSVLPHGRAFAFVKSVVAGLFRHHAFDHAATMAFYFFLGSIPLLVVFGLLVGAIVQRSGADLLAEPLYHAMPGAAAKLIRQELQDIASEHASSIAPLSFIGFVWLTTNGVHNLMDVFEVLVGARPRSWLRQRGIAILWVAGTLVTLVTATWFLLVANGVALELQTEKGIPGLLRRPGDFLGQTWQRVGVVLVVVFLATMGLAIFYRVAVVHKAAIRRRVWPGTLVGIVLWTVVTWGFGAYVRTIGHYAVYYGSLATVAVVLLWLYVSSLAIVVGAEVNAQLEGVRRDHPVH